ncbi:MAG: NAD-dependent epimerase/dehydratase family protein, partial [Anaerolineae bacterium]|nr:NAD-dependent epimerase/dehydratase family protein [Anaerolineae bacterium]
MHILITGATGFVGTHLRRYLLSTTDWTISGTAFPDAPRTSLDSERETLVHLDLCNKSSTYATIADIQPDYIVHLAAQSHVPTSYD